MLADAQIGGILSFFNHLMSCPRVAYGLLLRANVLIQRSIACFKFAPRSRYVLFDRGKFRFDRAQFFFCHAYRLGAAQARADKFCAFVRQPRLSRADGG